MADIFDVTVIGAGVVGALTARELTKYNLKVALLEKESDVAMGTSKGNSAIVHAGFDAENGSLKAELNVKGCKMMQSVANDLGVRYRKNGSLVCAFSDKETEHLEVLKKRGINNGLSETELEIIMGESLFDLEPNLSREVKAALYAPTAGLVCPYFLTIAAAENAVLNGCNLILSFTVNKIESNGGFLTVKSADGREIATRYIINSAGLYSDDIAKMCGDSGQIEEYTIIPRKGEYMLMDKKVGSFVNTTLFSVPSDKGKGILVSPSVDGNLIIGPNAVVTTKDDVSTSAEGLAEITQGAEKLVPSLDMRQVITSFAGVRATPKNHDFNIIPSQNTKNVLHLIGIESPGLASSPAIAEYAVRILKYMGLKLSPKTDFNPTADRRKSFRSMTAKERAAAIGENKLYAKIICRCETVTEAEIVDFIHSSCPATTIDAVKRRTRAGMGRCQGGFCSPRVADILSRELGADMLDVTKKGDGSHILTGKTK
ncbi:MAG: NAD(P)/FAD-dependent oxidoreductase [Oscillospiraceae bacterium]|nr:NAD(P)/FAD-dependent oxidoreductase [Oscillospiraceae bacterium]